MFDVTLGLWLIGCLVANATNALPPIPPGARSHASEDSLSYEQFRSLSADEQRENRERARDWYGLARDALRVSEGRRPQVPWRFYHRPQDDDEYQEHLRLALDFAATAVGYCPYDVECWIQYAEVALRIGRDDIAVACTAHARKTLPYERDEEVRAANRTEVERIAAIANFNLRRFGAAKSAADYILSKTPRAWDIRLVAARSALQLGQYGEAQRLSTAVPESSPEYALSRAVLGAAELGLGHHETAGEAFEEARVWGLVSPEFENDQGRLSLAVGEPEVAARHFRAALQLEPGFATAACNLATALCRTGELTAAEDILVAQLTRSPENGPVHLALAEVYRDFAAETDSLQRREYAVRALDQYNLALEYGASADHVLDRRASLAIYLDGVESVENYILALAAEQKASAHVLAVLARIKKSEGRLDIAEGILRMATSQDDANGIVYAEFGEVLLRRKNYVEARDALTTACSMDPRLVVSRVNLSLVCELLGDMPAAWAALDEAIALDPQHPLVLERIETAGHL